MDFDYPDGATPLTPEEEEDLLLTHITTRDELNRWERDNILEAMEWAFKGKKKSILTREFAKDLHKRMFNTVWKWAGEFRITGKNIGIPANQIDSELISLLGNISYWAENTTFPADEIAARFHHKLTAIHPFPNGNGRHARLMCDMLLVHVLDSEPFTWGSGNLVDAGDTRKTYIAALHNADRHDYSPLLEFVRT